MFLPHGTSLKSTYVLLRAGSPERRAALAAVTSPETLCVLNSRDSTGWKEAVMGVTNGRGVDVLLNSLFGTRSLELLILMLLRAPCMRTFLCNRLQVVHCSINILAQYALSMQQQLIKHHPCMITQASMILVVCVQAPCKQLACS